MDLVTAEGPEMALRLLGEKSLFAVVVADMQMPGMSGVELLDQLHRRCPDTVCVMFTGNADQGTAASTINRGAVFRFLNKPCDAQMLSAVLRDAIRQHELIAAEKTLLSHTLRGSVKVMIDLLGMVDPASQARAVTLRNWASALCGPLKVAKPWGVEIAAMLAPLAFMTLPASVRENANKPSRLSPEEKQALASAQASLHAPVAQLPRMEGVARILQHLTTRYDGANVTDPPLRGSKLPMGSLVLHTLHDLVELQSEGLSIAAAVDMLTKLTGKHDPDVLEAIDRYIITPTERVPTAVPVRDLLVGQVVAVDVKDKAGRLLLGQDETITETARTALWNHHALRQLAEPVVVYMLRARNGRAA